MGRAGDSARREYERRLARDRARIRSNRGQRIAVVAITPVAVFCAVRFGIPWVWNAFATGVSSSADVESSRSALDPGVLNLAAGAVCLGATVSVWQQMFGRRRTTDAWRRGAEGEALTARILARLPDGYVVAHDLPMPRSRANIDHVVIGPTGAFTIETKRYANGVSINGRRVRASGRSADKIVDQATRQAQAMSGWLGLPVTAIVVVHGGVTLGWLSSPTVGGVRFCSPGKLRKVITRRPSTLAPGKVAEAAERLPGSQHREPVVPIGPQVRSEVADGQPKTAARTVDDDLCTCGGRWVERRRRSDGAAFFGCSRFPACRRTRALQ